MTLKHKNTLKELMRDIEPLITSSNDEDFELGLNIIENINKWHGIYLIHQIKIKYKFTSITRAYKLSLLRAKLKRSQNEQILTRGK